MSKEMWTERKSKRQRCPSDVVFVILYLFLVNIPVIAGFKLVRPISKRLNIVHPSSLRQPVRSSHDQTHLHMHPYFVSLLVGSATLLGNVKPTVASFFETTDYNVKSTSLLKRVVDTTLHSTTTSHSITPKDHHKSSYDVRLLSHKPYRLPHFTLHTPLHVHPLRDQWSHLHLLPIHHHHQPHQHQHFALRRQWKTLQQQIPWTASYQKQHVHKQQHLSVVDTLKAGMPQAGVLFALAEVVDDTYEVLVNDPTEKFDSLNDMSQQSSGWEASRAKRTAAMKDLEKKGIVQVDTDDVGNQFLKLPWIPDRKVPYKSLSIGQRLQNEVCAGAFGEFSKDMLLHAVDTKKTRKQAMKKRQLSTATAIDIATGVPVGSNNGDGVTNAVANNGVFAVGTMTSNGPFSNVVTNGGSASFTMVGGGGGGGGASGVVSLSVEEPLVVWPPNPSSLSALKSLYAGFPVVMASSIPQGGMFFLVKKGTIEILNLAPNLPSVLSSTIPIGFATMAYWAFRTPAEVLKTQVQTGQVPNVIEAYDTAKISNPKGVLGLWKHYPVMLWLDIPFQIINFILYGLLSEAVAGAGFSASVWTRLFCGVMCGMTSAGLTCPVDVCKTRIISRDKVQQQAYLAAVRQQQEQQQSVFAIPEGSSGSSSGSGLIIDIDSSEETTTITTETTSSTASSSSTSSSAPNTNPTNSDSVESILPIPIPTPSNNNVLVELQKIALEEGPSALFLGIRQRLLYVGLANGIRLAAYGTSRMDLMMRSLDNS